MSSLRISNALGAREIPAGSARTARPPLEREPVEVRLVVDGAESWVPGLAVAWVGQAVWVEVRVGLELFEVWLRAGDVRRR